MDEIFEIGEVGGDYISVRAEQDGRVSIATGWADTEATFGYEQALLICAAFVTPFAAVGILDSDAPYTAY